MSTQDEKIVFLSVCWYVEELCIR